MSHSGQVLAGVFTAVAISLTTGRFFIRNRNGGSGLLTAAALSDHLNGAAAVVLVGMVAAKSYFLPLYYAVQLWAADLGPGVEHKDMITYYQVGVGTFMLFWVVIYLVKFSFLMLYRSLFAVSKSFRAVWWGVFVFNMMAFFICFLSVLWTCGHPGKLFNTSQSLSPCIWIGADLNDRGLCDSRCKQPSAPALHHRLRFQRALEFDL